MAKAKVPSLSLPAKVSTKLGHIFITPTEANHLHVSSRDGNGSTEKYLTLRGCEYYISAHFYLWKGGSFHLGEEARNEYERRQSLYISNHGASESARTKLDECLTTAVTHDA